MQENLEQALEEKLVVRTIDAYTIDTIVLYTPAPKPFEPINHFLDGGLFLDLKKSTPNTTIIKEDIGPIRNMYIHHDDGPGRLETNIFGKNYK